MPRKTMPICPLENPPNLPFKIHQKKIPPIETAPVESSVCKGCWLFSLLDCIFITGSKTGSTTYIGS